MAKDIIYRERYGTKGKYDVYTCEGEDIARIDSHQSLKPTVYEHIKSFSREVFLPHGYPGSVSDDYLHYQVWDTVQAFFSTITGTLTTQAIMKGVGVGSMSATAFSAAITWILKDGTGMAGKIVFAWWKGSQFDADCKKWRLFADVLNDAAMCIELLVPYFMGYSTQVLCIATAMKSLVGVAGGATRAALTQHQAIRDNMADVSAKDGSQETCVNLLASIVGILILSTFDEGEYVWLLFTMFTICHLFANYRAVRALKMVTLNSARFTILLRSYLVSETIGSPEHVNLHEDVILGRGQTVKNLCGFDIKLGASLKATHLVSPDEVKLLGRFYRHRDYLLCIHIKQRTIFVFLHQEATATDVIQAYYHAVLLGIALCMITEIPLPIITKKRLTVASYPVKRLRNALIKYCSRKAAHRLSVAFEAMLAADEIITNEFPKFLACLHKEGWNTNSHHLAVDEWRGDWSKDQVEEIVKDVLPDSRPSEALSDPRPSEVYSDPTEKEHEQ